MADAKSSSKKTSPLIFVGIGCVVLLFLIGVGTQIFVRFFAKRAIEGVIQQKTGVDVSNVQNGKMTFTDTKTGTQVNVGANQVPDNFPKDFPIYPGAKVTGSLSGAQAGKESGFWITMTTADSTDQVSGYYKTQLATNGWTVTSTFTANSTLTESVTKTGWTGSLTVTPGTSGQPTQIVIALGQDNATPTPTE